MGDEGFRIKQEPLDTNECYILLCPHCLVVCTSEQEYIEHSLKEHSSTCNLVQVPSQNINLVQVPSQNINLVPTQNIKRELIDHLHLDTQTHREEALDTGESVDLPSPNDDEYSNPEEFKCSVCSYAAPDQD